MEQSSQIEPNDAKNFLGFKNDVANQNGQQGHSQRNKDLNNCERDLEGVNQDHSAERENKDQKPRVKSHDLDCANKDHSMNHVNKDHPADHVNKDHNPDHLKKDHNPDHLKKDHNPDHLNKDHNPDHLNKDHNPDHVNKDHNPDHMNKDHNPDHVNKDHNPDHVNKDHNPDDVNKDHNQQTAQVTQRPFAHLSIVATDFLEAAADAAGSGRSACPGCGRSRRYYCPMCCVPVPPGQPLPTVRIPFSVCILKHPAEFHGKSTSPHAVILSPDCRIVRYPLLPDLPDRDFAAVVFPAPAGCISVAELAARMSGGPVAAASEEPAVQLQQEAAENRMRRWTIIFVDSTWRQANAIVNDERLRGLPRVALSNHASHYWRYEEGLTPGHLSTIEAIYYLCVDVHLALCQLGYCRSCGGVYDGRYDNLLMYFNHLYSLLYTCYDGGRACGDRKRKHFQLK